jgi:hypothetical protein
MPVPAPVMIATLPSEVMFFTPHFSSLYIRFAKYLRLKAESISLRLKEEQP